MVGPGSLLARRLFRFSESDRLYLNASEREPRNDLEGIASRDQRQGEAPIEPNRSAGPLGYLQTFNVLRWKIAEPSAVRGLAQCIFGIY
jgi:hypothetical protein